MTFSIADWSGHDRSQYFTNAYVRINTDTGNSIGKITGFNGDSVTVNVNGIQTRVPLSAIDWDGLAPPKCVAQGGHLYFISPLGARTTRKPVTRGNLGAVIISTSGRRKFGNSEPSSAVIQQYLGESVYPNNAEDAYYTATNNLTCVLSSHTGTIICDAIMTDSDGERYQGREYRIYQHSVLVQSFDDVGLLHQHLIENWSTYCE